MEIALAGSRWRFLPERAVYSAESGMLVVADVHFGKAATFRAAGVPVPSGTTQGNLARLSALIEATQPQPDALPDDDRS